jgi:hypothetical protein
LQLHDLDYVRHTFAYALFMDRLNVDTLVGRICRSAEWLDSMLASTFGDRGSPERPTPLGIA